MIQSIATMLLLFIVVAATAVHAGRCPSGLMGEWEDGTATLSPAGRIAIGACTRKDGDKKFTDMNGDPCTTTVCNNANIVIGSSGKFCTVTVSGDGCGGTDRSLFYRCRRTGASKSAEAFRCKFIKTVFQSGEEVLPASKVIVSAKVSNNGDKLRWTPKNKKGNALGSIIAPS